MAKLNCKICGRSFTYEKTRGGGREPGFCSDECRRRARSKTNTKSLLKRYHKDEDFREKRIRENVIGNRRRREARRAQVMDKLVDDLMKAQTPEEIRALLESRVRIRAELYANKLPEE